MIGLGFGVFFAGYTLLAYGWSQLRGCNASFISLAWPSPNGFPGCNPDPPNPSNPGNLGKGAATTGGVTIKNAAQAQKILADPKSTKAQKQSAAAWEYINSSGAGNLA